MERKRRRPTNWCQPMIFAGPQQPTEFERRVQALGLRSEQAMLRSKELREWVRAHWKSRYVPEALLTAWDIASKFELEDE